jgi:RNA polymerase subunit RPABC4/transcription elongation factor Spt4
MRRHCHHCKTLLGMWETRCPCCRTSAMRWLHLFAIGAFSLTVVFYVLVVAR